MMVHVYCVPNCKTGKVQACGISDLFDFHLPEYAQNHKGTYASMNPHAMIWDTVALSEEIFCFPRSAKYGYVPLWVWKSFDN